MVTPTARPSSIENASVSRRRLPDAITRLSFRLHQLVAGGELHGDEVVARLIEACERNGYLAKDGLRSVERTIASGRAAGLQYPRSRKGAQW
jgi:hypothetical protein